jgi:hypothetical protein
LASALFGAFGDLGAQYDAGKELARKRNQDDAEFALKQQQGKRNDEYLQLQIEQSKRAQNREGWDSAITFRNPTDKKLYQYNPLTMVTRQMAVPEGAITSDNPMYELKNLEDALGHELPDELKNRYIAKKLGIPPEKFGGKFLGTDDKGKPVWMAYDPEHPDKKVVLGPAGTTRRTGTGGGDGSGIGTPTGIKDWAQSLADGQHKASEVPTKLRTAVNSYMRANGMKVKKQLNAQQQALTDTIKQIAPKVQTLKNYLETNKLTERNSIGDIIGAQLAWRQYKSGQKPAEPYATLIKNAAALKVMGAAPWVRLGRGRYMYEEIVQHLPSPTDSPALLYNKMQFLQTILDEANAALVGDQASAQDVRTGGALGAIDPSTILAEDDAEGQGGEQ